MKDFKAIHKRSYYKDDNAYLDAVYRNNKAIIDEAYQGIIRGKSAKSIFKESINGYITEDGYSLSKSLKVLARSTTFTTNKERLTNNFYSGLVADKEAYKLFRELTKEHGRYSKFDTEQLRYNKEENVYVYNDKVIISFENSPLQVVVKLI